MTKKLSTFCKAKAISNGFTVRYVSYPSDGVLLEGDFPQRLDRREAAALEKWLDECLVAIDAEEKANAEG
jgi:hypothetical protein